jgi:NAD(P)-dependent dehydrogenase (short-subunit alcohol dehydrogenase family)
MRVAVVTGASSGIGAELCRALAARGWRVVGLSRRPAEHAHEFEECDVADHEAVAAVAARVLERHPRIDLLVNNAGRKGPRAFVGADPGEVESHVRTNYLGGIWCLNAFLPGMGPGSHVVNMVSVAGTVAYGPYSATKHAQLAFSRSIAYELVARDIRVHTINPGFVDTPGFPQRGRFPFPLSHVLVVRMSLVVERTLRAIEYDQREIVVPRWYAPASWAQAVVPGVVARVLGRVGHR